jgi:hypothetical protein
MKYIPLTKNKFAIIDDDDFERVSIFKWHYEHGYARVKNKQESFYLHQFILGKNSKEIDHINNNPLDNRKVNLRVCSCSENSANSSAHKDSQYSKFKGVSFHKTLGYWISDFCHQGKRFRKYSKSEKDACLKYNELVIKYGDCFNKLNLI